MDYNKTLSTRVSDIFLLVLVLITGVLFFVADRAQKTENHLSLFQTDRLNSIYDSATIKTNFGVIEFDFFSDDAPRAVNSFIELAKIDFFDGTKFHRVIDNFIIQGGDPLSRGDDKSKYGLGDPGYVFKDEINDHKMTRGTVAMANKGKDTNGSQFFIVVDEHLKRLEGKYTIFGRVSKGMAVVDQISKLKTDARDVPITPVIVLDVVLD